MILEIIPGSAPQRSCWTIWIAGIASSTQVSRTHGPVTPSCYFVFFHFCFFATVEMLMISSWLCALDSPLMVIRAQECRPCIRPGNASDSGPRTCISPALSFLSKSLICSHSLAFTRCCICAVLRMRLSLGAKDLGPAEVLGVKSLLPASGRTWGGPETGVPSPTGTYIPTQLEPLAGHCPFSSLEHRTGIVGYGIGGGGGV